LQTGVSSITHGAPCICLPPTPVALAAMLCHAVLCCAVQCARCQDQPADCPTQHQLCRGHQGERQASPAEHRVHKTRFHQPRLVWVIASRARRRLGSKMPALMPWMYSGVLTGAVCATAACAPHVMLGAASPARCTCRPPLLGMSSFLLLLPFHAAPAVHCGHRWRHRAVHTRPQDPHRCQRPAEHLLHSAMELGAWLEPQWVVLYS
jgi:hypothetical protein